MNPNFQKILAASLLSCGIAAAQVPGFTNHIRVVEMGGGTGDPMLWDIPNVAATGDNVLVDEPVPEGGATFLLSTIQASPFLDYYLAQTSIGAYLPRAELEVVTHDTTSIKPRIRADQPFRIQATVSGLFEPTIGIPAGNVQQAAREVRLLRFKQDYAEGEYSLPGGDISSSAYQELVLEGNGQFPQAGGDDLTFYSGLNPNDPLKARGEEHVIVRSLDDGGVAGSALDKVEIEVWPVWEGDQQGLVDSDFVDYSYNGPIENMGTAGEGAVTPDGDFVPAPGMTSYIGVPPDVTFSWRDLYPTSEIAVIVNDADKPYPWGGKVVSGTRFVYNDDQSFDKSLTVTKEQWQDVFSGPGHYTAWMVTQTPGIGWEVGGRMDAAGNLQPGGWSIPISRAKIEVRGSIHSVAD